MLFPRGGIDFCPHDCGADSLRTGTISADLSKLGREGRGRSGVWDAILACDPKSACPRCHGFARIDWSTHACPVARSWSNCTGPQGQSLAPLRPWSYRFARHHLGIAAADGCDFRLREPVTVVSDCRRLRIQRLQPTRELTKNDC